MKVVITRQVPSLCLEKLEKAGFQLFHNQEDATLDKDALIKRLSTADAAVTSMADTLDEAVISACPNLKIIANYAVGFNNIDLKAAARHGIIVTNTPGVLSDSTAEIAVALIFAVSRRSMEADRYVRGGHWQTYKAQFLLGQDVHHKVLGVVGAGRIGQALVKKMSGFEMPVLYHNRKRDLEFEKATGAKYVSLEELLSTADIISLHMPLTSETEKMIGAKELKLLKKTAILINTARGRVIDEAALVTALEEKWFYGAGLDVFENEPHVPQKLLGMDNVVLFPHIGSASVETRNAMGSLCADNIISFFKDGTVLTQVKG